MDVTTAKFRCVLFSELMGLCAQAGKVSRYGFWPFEAKQERPSAAVREVFLFINAAMRAAKAGRNGSGVPRYRVPGKVLEGKQRRAYAA